MHDHCEAEGTDDRCGSSKAAYKRQAYYESDEPLSSDKSFRGEGFFSSCPGTDRRRPIKEIQQTLNISSVMLWRLIKEYLSSGMKDYSIITKNYKILSK